MEEQNKQNSIPGISGDTEIFDYKSGIPLNVGDVVNNRIKAKVLSLKGNNKSFGNSFSEFDLSDVTGWSKSMEKTKVIRLVTSYGEPINTSPEQKVLSRQGWKRAKDLKEGEYILKINKCQVRLGDNKFNKDYARFLGYWLGDGSSDFRKTPNIASIDKAIIQDLRRIAINKGYKLIYGKPLSYYFVDKLPPRRSWDGRIISTNIFNLLLRDLGLLGKHEEKKIIPLKIFSLRKAYLAEVLCGLFMTDGTVNKIKATVEFCNISETMVKQIHYLLLATGIHSRVWKQENNSRGKHPLWILSINGIDKLKEYGKLVTLIGEKAKKLKYWCDQPIRKDNKGKRISFSKNLFCEKVLKIENLDNQTVYSLSTDKYNNYLANECICSSS
ncbi:hypothetical protein MUP46_04280 [Patescibacteria group bacterium]|nr:hypothetical protein [Patescibacteria group bacterium]